MTLSDQQIYTLAQDCQTALGKEAEHAVCAVRSRPDKDGTMDLDSLADLRKLADRIDVRTSAEIIDLRNAGVSWAAIGDVFGISRQAAQQRFGYGYEPPRAAR